VENDLYLKYVLELRKSGYTIPEIIRKDISYTRMIQMLQDKWKRIEVGEPKFIHSPDQDDFKTYFADGVYAYCYRFEDHDDGSCRSNIHFYQLSSPNTGIEFKDWSHNNLDISVRAFAIQPRIDLMVLLESYAYLDERGRFMKRYRIHLRSMSTNQPHPCAVDAAPLLNLGRLEYHFITRRPPIHIYGRMLSLIFRPDLDDPVGEPLIVVFDWVAGVEVGVSKIIC
jgi:hypothetical protein